MIRSFCVGAVVGFVFGSSKQGAHLRDIIDGFITSLLSEDEESSGGNKASKKDDSRVARFGSKSNGNGHNGNGSSRRTENGASTERSRGTAAVAEREDKQPSGTKSGETGVTLDKVQELAETLNAKPVPPETDEIQPS